MSLPVQRTPNGTQHERRGVLYRTVQTLTLAGSLLLPCLGVAAGDTKMTTAAVCTPQYPSQAASVTYGSSGQLYNNSSQGVYVVCPMLRDNYDSPFTSLTLTVDDQHTTRDISCTVRVTGSMGDLLASYTDRSSGTGIEGIGKSRRCLTDASCSSVSYPYARYTARCYLPGRDGSRRASSITQLFIKER